MQGVLRFSHFLMVGLFFFAMAPFFDEPLQFFLQGFRVTSQEQEA
jgi:hypothetical protein